MGIAKEIKMICADVDSNNNKHWNLTLFDDGTLESRWGRVGGHETTTPYTGGLRKFNSLVAKKKKGRGGKSVYTELKVVGGNTSSPSKSIGGSELELIAKSQIQTSGDKILDKLVERLVKENIHRITSSTSITFNNDSGLFQTPLGIVTNDGIEEAKGLLVDIERVIKRSEKQKLSRLASNYLRIIPTDIGMKRIDPMGFFGGEGTKKQLDILDALSSSYEAMKKSPPKQKESGEVVEKVFDLSLGVASESEFERINKKFNKTESGMHSCHHLKLKSVYVVTVGEMADSFQKCKVGNIKEFWHGTKKANLLSILKSGLKCSPPSTASIAGKAYGNGIYFSDQSTKSLNYSYGYWGGGRDNNCFMFLADVAMGKEFIPETKGLGYYGRHSYPVKGYDSTFAKAGKSGVRNNEIIIYNNNQCNLTFLCEFAN